ncbi:MAG TPA: EAL domain-containing protein [Rhodocyclaceae bacterium]|jgi:diguanylate cyclase (GGDEF)-like protein/PAS domain S-box-containing protein
MSLRWQSLRTRLVVGILCATVLSLWTVTFFISHYLRQDMEAAISSQQFSSVSMIAAEIDRSVRERIDMLSSVANVVAAKSPLTADKTADLLEKQAALLPPFNWGIVVTDAQGVAVASIPQNLNRVGINYGHLTALREALDSGRPVMTEPLIGKGTGVPVVTLIVPIRNGQNQVVGVMMGITNLQMPNFLDEISSAKYGRTGDFMLTAPKSRTYIASSDKQRVMKSGPPPNVNPVYDRYLGGYEGSGVAVSSRGIEELSSSKIVPATGWLVQSVLPTKEAFAPIEAMHRRLLFATLLLTLFAGGIAWWWLRSQLRPLEEAASLLEKMRDGIAPRQALPLGRMDEIGQLAHAFNGLLVTIAEQEAQAAENAANRRLRKILSHVPGMVFEYRLHDDGNGSFPFASEAVKMIFGVSPEDVETDANKIRALLHPEDNERFFEAMHRSGKLLTPWQIDYRIKLGSGEIKWLHVDAVPEHGTDGLVTWYGFVTDVTATKCMESELRIAAATFESQEGIFVTDPDGVILRVNQAFTTITGYSPEDVVGRKPSFLKSGKHGIEFYAQLWNSLIKDGFWRGQIWNRRKNGEHYPEWVTISAVRDLEGRTTNYVAAFTDITEQKKAEDRIYNLAFFDPLTELPNRRLMMDRLHQAMAASERSLQHCALLLLDLDHFKVLNDTRGHDCGDDLLKQVALRLTSHVREGDTVARFGGDEFVILLLGLGLEARGAATLAESIAEKLRLALNEPFELSSAEYVTSSSIGISMFLDKGTETDVLLKQADLALYQAKGAGRNTIRFFDPVMQKALDDRAAIEAGLRDALKMGRLQLYYQPQVDEAGTLIGAEALLRWFDASGNSIPPAEFIPLAEETGLILQLGDWVLETACARLQAWAKIPQLANIVIAINVSARQFNVPNFVAQIADAMDRHGIGPGRLKIELTESVILDNMEEVVEKMNALKAIGVSFSLDDFGTGYSSLSYLKRLPIDQVKIDQGFVRDVVMDQDDAAIVEAIIGLGKTLRLLVIAEGVETAGQRDFLGLHSCKAYQGYLFGRPMAADDFERLLSETLPASTDGNV